MLVDVRLDALSTVCPGVTFVTVSVIGVGMLAGVDVNVVAAVMTALKFNMSVSLADSVPSC